MQWYEKTVHVWRTVGTIVWLIILMTPLLWSYILLSVSSLLPSVQSLIYTGVLYTSIVLLHITQSFLTKVKPVYSKVRYKTVFSMDTLSHCLFVLLCVAMATVQSHCLSSFNEYSWNYQGTIIGLLYGLRYVKKAEFVLQFSLIQQGRLFEIKRCLHKVIKSSIIHGLKDFVFCLLAYALIKVWSMNIINLVSNLVNIRLLWLLMFNGILMEFVWQLSVSLYHMYHIQGIHFPVIASFNEESDHTLLMSLQSNNDIVNYLGYMDLASLSMLSPLRRAQIFSLSTDGQPVIWNSIYEQCTTKLNSLITGLSSNEGEEDEGIIIPPVINTPRIVKREWSETTPTLTRRHINTERPTLSIQEVPPTQPTPTIRGGDYKGKSVESISSLSSCREVNNNYIKTIPFIAYLLKEVPDFKLKETMSYSLMYIWIITGLTHLCAHSYSEDKYGVVQKSLPQVIKTLLKLSKLMCNCSSTHSPTVQGHIALKNAIEQGLQLLACTFHKETRILNLTNDDKWNQLISTI